MKISQSVDTQNLTDKDAEVSLAVKNLYDVCLKYNCTMLVRAVLNDKKYIGAFASANLPEEKQKAHFRFLIDCLGHFTEGSTDGKLAIVKVKD